MKVSDISYEHQQVIEAMKSQLLIVLINRLGGAAYIPAEEVDETGQFNLAMSVDPKTRVFHFVVKRKKA